jgi:hypothetical protein
MRIPGGIGLLWERYIFMDYYTDREEDMVACGLVNPIEGVLSYNKTSPRGLYAIRHFHNCFKT